MMATVTQNFYVGPEDGWIEIVAAGTTVNFLDIKSFPCNHGFYVFIGDAQPDASSTRPVGRKVDGDCIFINVPFTGGVWARCLTPAYGGDDGTQEIRLDVNIITAP